MLAVFADSARAEDTTTSVTAESEWQFSVDQTKTVYIYGNSNQSCSEVTVDPYLWLYSDNGESSGQLIAQNDDGNHNSQDQCVSSKIVVELEPGDYLIRAGYCCQQLGLGARPAWGNGIYELVISDVVLTDTTSSTSTTSTEPATTTSSTSTTSPTTTTTELSSTTTADSTTTTTTVLIEETTLAPTTTQLPTQTTVPIVVAPPNLTTTSVATTTTTTTIAEPTTIPESSEVTTTWLATLPLSTATTTLSPTSTLSTTTSLAPTTAPTTTVRPTVPSVTTTLATEPQEATSEPTVADVAELIANTEASELVALMQVASDEVRAEFEAQVDLYSGDFDAYIPVGSGVPIKTRRIVIAVSVATTLPVARRKTV